MSGAAMYLTGPPSEVIASCTWGVSATGEKTAREPEDSLTVRRESISVKELEHAIIGLIICSAHQVFLDLQI